MTSQPPEDDAWKIEIVRCPISGERLIRADHELLTRLRQLALADGLATRGSELVRLPLEGGLISQSQRWFYREQSGVFLLTADDAIDLQQLPAG